MRALKIGTALLILSPILSACISMRASRTAHPEETRRVARLNLELVDQLGPSRSIDYIQVYLDGWLVWQGVPERGSQSLGTPAVTAGEQEVYVRVLVSTRDGSHGHLASTRKVFTIRAGSQRVRIRLSKHLGNPESFHVALVGR